jgi:hypothetical protein
MQKTAIPHRRYLFEKPPLCYDVFKSRGGRKWSEHWGREGARILLRSAPDVQAIFCGSDQ